MRFTGVGPIRSVADDDQSPFVKYEYPFSALESRYRTDFPSTDDDSRPTSRVRTPTGALEITFVVLSWFGSGEPRGRDGRVDGAVRSGVRLF